MCLIYKDVMQYVCDVCICRVESVCLVYVCGVSVFVVDDLGKVYCVLYCVMCVFYVSVCMGEYIVLYVLSVGGYVQGVCIYVVCVKYVICIISVL